MRTIWNPWHGCHRCSEGCVNCYMYYLDRLHGKDGSVITRSRSSFDYPLKKNRQGQYKVPSGTILSVCLTSDFFLEEADAWREEAWDIIRKRPDVIFWLLTKRPQRVLDHLPSDWGDGWENVMFNVTCENQKRTDERMPILLDLPFRHKGVMCAPLIGPVDLRPYLSSGKVEQVMCDGENYEGARICRYEWVKDLHEACRAFDVHFVFSGTGYVFEKDGRIWHLEGHVTKEQAARADLNVKGRPIRFHLKQM